MKDAKVIIPVVTVLGVALRMRLPTNMYGCSCGKEGLFGYTMMVHLQKEHGMTKEDARKTVFCAKDEIPI